MKNIVVCMAAVLVAISGCSREQVNAAVNSFGASYLESNKNGIVKNWQAKVVDTPHCHKFKDRFQQAGEKHTDAANGKFAMDMMTLWEEVKANQCAV